MVDEIPIQLYRSYLMIEQNGREKRHGIKRSNISLYGVRWRRLNKDWAQRAYDIHVAIDRTPSDGHMHVQALELIGEVFNNNTFGMEENHYNHSTFVSMVNDMVDHLANGKPRVLKALSWEQLLTPDDPEQRENLDSTNGTGFSFTWKTLDKMTSTPAGVLDILCVINTLTKLLQK